MSVMTAAQRPPAIASKLADRRFVMLLAAGVLAAIVLVSFFAPVSEDNDPSPTTYNNGSAGIKAAYLLLNQLGYDAERWEQPVSGLASVDARKTTLVLANPIVPPAMRDEVKAAIAGFLERGGRVLVTGVQGAYLIPGAHTTSPTQIYTALCFTTPEGQGALARAGQLSIDDTARWSDVTPASRVQQRCGQDAVVVSFRVGAGEAIWWSSPLPLSNRGLKEDASLRLVLASVGEPGRRVLFDESLRAANASIWDTAKGLPIRSLGLQAALVAVLLVLSFGRRSGPVRLPVRAVRGSPLEFAESMGHLYQKAGATQVATEGARRRLLRFLHERCGVPQPMLKGSPLEIVEQLQARLGGDWSGVGEHLRQAEPDGGKPLSPATALALVKALDGDLEQLRRRVEFSRSE